MMRDARLWARQQPSFVLCYRYCGVLLLLALPMFAACQRADRAAVQDLRITLTLFAPSYMTDLLANVVANEQNVRAMLTKVLRGEADAGIIYGSDVDATVRAQVQQIAIPTERNLLAAYPIAPVVESPQGPMAEQFIDFLLHPTGQEILTNYGFLN